MGAAGDEGSSAQRRMGGHGVAVRSTRAEQAHTTARLPPTRTCFGRCPQEGQQAWGA
ncbi:MAG TPA: hypothetical protein VIJ22_15110 [Polyangiaceae bacterium]